VSHPSQTQGKKCVRLDIEQQFHLHIFHLATAPTRVRIYVFVGEYETWNICAEFWSFFPSFFLVANRHVSQSPSNGRVGNGNWKISNFQKRFSPRAHSSPDMKRSVGRSSVLLLTHFIRLSRTHIHKCTGKIITWFINPKNCTITFK